MSLMPTWMLDRLARVPRSPLAMLRSPGLGALLTIALVGRGAIAPLPGVAAERIYASYGSLGASMPVDVLDDFARRGVVRDQMRFYARRLSAEQLAEFRNLLTYPVDLSPVVVSQFLGSPQGEAILQRLAAVIQTESQVANRTALRAALVLAASDPEGLTLLNVLHHYPTPGMRVDVAAGFGVFQALQAAIEEGGRAVAQVEAQARGEAAQEPLPEAVRDWRSPGPFSWQRQEIALVSSQRQTAFAVELYRPQLPAGEVAPVIVISHGLGSDRITYRYLAEHLTSYGFWVAVPEHPGSDRAYLEALLAGRVPELADPFEFLHRPQDIRDVLDYLERAAEPQFRGAIDVSRVGVIGQSFGGYTALALGGAALNFRRLASTCESSEVLLNPSLLLQCRALVVRPTVADRVTADDRLILRDRRIKAVFAINPLTSSLFGPEGMAELAVPVAWVAGSNDTAAVALPEQIRPFAGLAIADKFLILLRGGTHFSTLGSDGSESVQLPPAIVGPDPAIAWDYVRSLTVPFFRRYLQDQTGDQIYLSAAYAAWLSDPAMPLHLIRQLDPLGLPQRATQEAMPLDLP